MVDPTSDHAEGIAEEDAPRCTICGEAIVERATHRVRTWIADDSVRTVHFCETACLNQWDGPPD